MCCCDTPNVNGTFGYKWQPTDAPSTRPVNPPELNKGDELIHDEPGRCGGLDSHCHHYRVVKRYGSVLLLVRNGGGDRAIRLSGPILPVLARMDSNDRYWLLNAIYHANDDGAKAGRENEADKWRTAVVQKRVKTRKRRGVVTVVIEPLLVDS